MEELSQTNVSSTMDIFEMVAERRLTPEEGADILVFEQELRLSAIQYWIRKLFGWF